MCRELYRDGGGEAGVWEELAREKDRSDAGQLRSLAIFLVASYRAQLPQ